MTTGKIGERFRTVHQMQPETRLTRPGKPTTVRQAIANGARLQEEYSASLRTPPTEEQARERADKIARSNKQVEKVLGIDMVPKASE